MQGPWFPPLSQILGMWSAVSSEYCGFDPIRAVERMHQPERGSAKSRWGAMQNGSNLLDIPVCLVNSHSERGRRTWLPAANASISLANSLGVLVSTTPSRLEFGCSRL